MAVTEYPDLAKGFATIVNAERLSRGHNELYMLPYLNACALTRAKEAVKKLSHERPDGTSFSSVVDEKYFTWNVIYENIVAGRKNAAEAAAGLQGSEANWSSAMSENTIYTGVACIYDSTSTYKWYYVQIYAFPLEEKDLQRADAYLPANLGFADVTISAVDSTSSDYLPVDVHIATDSRVFPDSAKVTQNGVDIDFSVSETRSTLSAQIQAVPALFSGIPYGSHRAEITVPSGYFPVEGATKAFSVDYYGNPSVNSVNFTLDTLRLGILSVDDNTCEPLAGTTTKITCQSSIFPENIEVIRDGSPVDYQISGDRKEITFVSGSSPTFFSKINADKYSVLEHIQPDGYIKPDPVVISVWTTTNNGKYSQKTTTDDENGYYIYHDDHIVKIQNTLRILPSHPIAHSNVICVYDLSEPQSGFISNGEVVLTPSECTGLQSADIWDITLVHPIDDSGKWKYLMFENVIKAGGQLFRIEKFKITGHSVTVHANHISHDMAHNLIHDSQFYGGTGQDFIDFAIQHSKVDLDETFYPVYEFAGTSDIADRIDGDSYYNVNLLASLIGVDNCMINRFGGELYRDNFYFSINERMENAVDNAFNLRYNCEMEEDGLSQSIDASDVCTKLDAVDNFGNGFSWFYTVEGGQWAFHHHRERMVKFNYSDSATAMDQLGRDSGALWKTIGTPKVTYLINLAQIESDPRYSDFVTQLSKVRYGDRGIISCPELGFSTTQQVTEVEFDYIRGRIVSLCLGNVIDSIVRPDFMSSTVTNGRTLIDKLAK